MNKIVYKILEWRGIKWGDKIEKPFDKFLWRLIK